MADVPGSNTAWQGPPCTPVTEDSRFYPCCGLNRGPMTNWRRSGFGGVLPPRRLVGLACSKSWLCVWKAWLSPTGCWAHSHRARSALGPESLGECSSWLISHVTQEAAGLWASACPQCSRVQQARWAPSRFPRHWHPMQVAGRTNGVSGCADAASLTSVSGAPASTCEGWRGRGREGPPTAPHAATIMAVATHMLHAGPCPLCLTSQAHQAAWVHGAAQPGKSYVLAERKRVLLQEKTH